MNMSIIIKELNLLRKVKSKSTQENSYKHISSQENNLSDETKNEHRDSNAINLQINESFSKMVYKVKYRFRKMNNLFWEII